MYERNLSNALSTISPSQMDATVRVSVDTTFELHAGCR